MNVRKMVVGSTLAAGLVASGLMIAQEAPNVDARLHPNLANAQRACDQAYGYLKAAQRANEWDMHGHATRAEQLLQEANREIKAAALEANRKGR
jgi:hypothetical protein